MPRFVTVLLLLSSFPAMANSADTPEARLAAAGFTLPPPPQAGRDLRHLGADGKPAVPVRPRRVRRAGDPRQARRRRDARAGRPFRAEGRAVHAGDHQGSGRRAVPRQALRPDPRYGAGDRGFQGPPEGREWLFRPDGRRLRRGGPRRALGRRHAVAAVQYRSRDRGHRRVARRKPDGAARAPGVPALARARGPVRGALPADVPHATVADLLSGAGIGGTGRDADAVRRRRGRDQGLDRRAAGSCGAPLFRRQCRGCRRQHRPVRDAAAQSFALFRQLPRLRWQHRPSVRGRARARRRRPV